MRCVISKKSRKAESSNEGFYVADIAGSLLSTCHDLFTEARAGPNSFYFLSITSPPSVHLSFSIISSEITNDFETNNPNDRDFFVKGFLKLSETFMSEGLRGQRNSIKADRRYDGS